MKTEATLQPGEKVHDFVKDSRSLLDLTERVVSNVSTGKEHESTLLHCDLSNPSKLTTSSTDVPRKCHRSITYFGRKEIAILSLVFYLKTEKLLILCPDCT